MDQFLSFMFHVCLCYTVMYVPCSLWVIRQERADLLALLCVMFPCVFVAFNYGVSGRVWYWIISIPDLCLLLYFYYLYTITFYIFQPQNAFLIFGFQFFQFRWCADDS